MFKIPTYINILRLSYKWLENTGKIHEKQRNHWKDKTLFQFLLKNVLGRFYLSLLWMFIVGISIAGKAIVGFTMVNIGYSGSKWQSRHALLAGTHQIILEKSFLQLLLKQLQNGTL